MASVFKEVRFIKPTEISISELAKRYYRHPGPFVITEEDLCRIFPGIENIKISYPGEHIKGDADPQNYTLIMRAVKYFKPKIIVEVGTFRGKTAHGMAIHSPPESSVITIGLPIEKMTGQESYYGTDKVYFLKKEEIGSIFKGTPEEQKIKQIFADSHSLECELCLDKLLAGRQIEFAFIDSAHDYESVKQDFEGLILPRLAMCSVVMFDDYGNIPTHPGITDYLTEKARKDNFVFYWYAPYHHPDKRNTSCVFYLNIPETKNYRWREII